MRHPQVVVYVVRVDTGNVRVLVCQQRVEKERR